MKGAAYTVCGSSWWAGVYSAISTDAKIIAPPAAIVRVNGSYLNSTEKMEQNKDSVQT